MPTKHDGQSDTASRRPSTKTAKAPASPPITMGKDKSSKANKVPNTGMGR